MKYRIGQKVLYRDNDPIVGSPHTRSYEIVQIENRFKNPYYIMLEKWESHGKNIKQFSKAEWPVTFVDNSDSFFPEDLLEHLKLIKKQLKTSK